MRILGVNLSNNGSICLLDDGKIELYLEAERLTKKKRDSDCTKLFELVKDIDKVAISDAYWKNRIKNIISSKNIATLKKKFPNAELHDFRDRHHLTHAACGFYNSEFEEAAVITVDSSGSHYEEGDECETIMHVKRGRRFHWKTLHKRYNKENDYGIGLQFDLVSEKCKWGRMEAGKVMGLAPYGKYIEGQYLASSNENAAATIQKDWEDRSVELVKIAAKKCNNIVLTGGCFLNVVVNYKLLKEFPDLNFYVDPISFDGGTAIGAAYILHNNPKIKSY
tara:strand:+ start:82 stop:918 length:837 start_codon:yes stop_codon:yes gene_type:complete